MLRTLYIENIAVIEKTSIDFENGLNVLTGETGAGKSIIIDAINAIMGQRTSKEIIRTEADSAFVSAQFDDINQSIVEKLDELGFSDDEGTLILQRTLNRNGKSSCKINGKPATVSMLKELSKHLINIHGQHESYELFSPETHIDYIDRFGCCEKLLADYKKCYDEYKILKKKLNSADSDESERLKEIDLLSYQVNELTESDVKQGEEQELESERTALMSFEKIFSLLNGAKMALDGDENYGGGLESVDSASTALQKASSYNAEYEEIANTLTDAYYNLKDCCDSISDAIDSLESDPQRLEEVEERLDLINRLTRKYNCPSDELSDLAEKYQARLDELMNYDRNRDELAEKCRKREYIGKSRSYKFYQSGELIKHREDDREYMGRTLYLGSLKSDVYFCIYEKDYEQYVKLGTPLEEADIINRFEIRLRNERAYYAVRDLLTYYDAEQTAFSIINQYVRFVDEEPDKRKNDWKLNDRWAWFIGDNRQSLKLTTKPEPYTLDRTLRWVQRQVAPTLKMLKKIDKGNGTDYMETIEQQAKLTEKHEMIIKQQTTPAKDLVES